MISFSLGVQAHVKLEVFDLFGRSVATLFEGEKSAGEHHILWSAKHLSSGIYFYKLTIGQRSQMRKALLVK